MKLNAVAEPVLGFMTPSSGMVWKLDNLFFHLLFCIIYRQRLLVGLSGWKDLGIIDEQQIYGDNLRKEGIK